MNGTGENQLQQREEPSITQGEIEGLREAVRVRDELLEEMQTIMTKETEESQRSVEAAQRLLVEQEAVYEKRLTEKEKQIGLLKQILDTQAQASGIVLTDEEKKTQQQSTSKSSRNDRDSELDAIISSLKTEEEDIGEIQQEDSVLDDFLFNVLAKRDSLQDQLYDITEQLVMTKTTLGSSELEKERALQEVRRLKRLLERHDIDYSNSTSSLINPNVDQAPISPKKTEPQKLVEDRTADLEIELEKKESRLRRKETLRVNDQIKFRDQIKSLESEKEALTKRVVELEDTTAQDQTIAKLTASNAELLRELDDIKGKYIKANEHALKLEKENDELSSSVAKFVEDDAAGEVKELHSKIVHLSDTIISREDKISLLSQTIEELKKDINALQTDLQEQKDIVKKKEGVETSLSELQTNMKSVEETLVDTSAELESTRSMCKGLEDEVSSLHKERLSLTSKVEELEKLNKEYSTTIQEQNAKIDTFKLQQEELENLRLVLKGRSDDMEKREAFIKEVEKRFKAEQKLRRALHDQLMELRGNIRVQCRVRCILPHEAKKKKSGREIVFASDIHTVNIEQKGEFRSFEFDHVHGPDTNNEGVFLQLQSLVTSFVDGYNVCIMAYGQTGSGKTHTMLGPGGGEKSGDMDGIIYRFVEDIFKLTTTQSVENDYVISVTVCEVYNNKIRDLLGDDGDEKHDVSVGADGSVDVPTLTKHPATTPEQVLEAINEGMLSRAKRATNLNEHSSRSHLVVAVTNSCTSKLTGKTVESKLYMVDLAGSENNKMAKQSGDGLREAKNINKSLSALGDVMCSLSEKKSQPKRYIPYRNSTLTLLLKDAIGGNAKTLLLACVSPTEKFAVESINTLRFGSRARTVERGRITVASSKQYKRRKPIFVGNW